MEISELTGLPELIEDHFWRVGEVKDRDYGMSIFGPPSGAYIALVKREKVTITQDKVIHLPFGMAFNWGYETVEKWEESEVIRAYIYKTETRPVDVYNADEEKIGVRDEERTLRISADDLNPELILKFAEQVLEQQRQINKARGYLGDYPPKHLDRPELENN